MNKVLYIIILLCFSVTCVNASDSSWGKKKKKKAGTEKVESSDSTSKAASTGEYEKFMKDAVVKKGMFNVIKKKDKIYLEIPKAIMSRDFLISSRVSSTSRTCRLIQGTINRDPLLITFSCDENKVYTISLTWITCVRSHRKCTRLTRDTVTRRSGRRLKLR